jgi:hypothetical protein
VAHGPTRCRTATGGARGSSTGSRSFCLLQRLFVWFFVLRSLWMRKLWPSFPGSPGRVVQSRLLRADLRFDMRAGMHDDVRSGAFVL